ncbi:MAG: hypothetical protein J5842_07390 [Lachnospiraceae bacterium]|nr:hypothetical protein [Lachnospiraceae bacterium]
MIAGILLCFIWMVLLPLLAGAAFLPALKKGSERVGAATVFCIGLVIHEAYFEILTICGNPLGIGFRRVCIIFAASMILLGIFGACCLVRYKDRIRPIHPVSLIKDPHFIIALLLIGFQIYAILRYAAPDPDDAFYSSLSSMSLSYDMLLDRDAYGGLMQRAVQKRYAFSALPVYQAGLSYLSGSLHHLFICHNLFPLFYIPLSYGLYAELVRMLTAGGQKNGRAAGQDNEEAYKDPVWKDGGKALLTLAVLHTVGNYYLFTQETFLMTRLWQGKGLFAAIGIPALLLFGMKAEERGLFGWIMVSLTMLAIVFMGGTGLFLAPGMLILIRGAVFITSDDKKHEIKNIIASLICCLPQALLIIWMMS